MKKKKDDLLSVIVPAYRQERTIKENLQRIDDVLSQSNFSYEIICVVDGVVDNTFDEASEVKSSRIRVEEYSTNQGKGYAVKHGMKLARGNIIAFIDAGLELGPETILMGLEHYYWYKADIIVGSKRHPASKIHYPFSRQIVSLVYQLLVRILFGLKIRDTQLGMKIFKKDVLDTILPRLLVKRYAFDIEMLAVAYYLGFKRIFESPIEIKYDFEDLTHAATVKSIWQIFWDTLAVFYRLRILHYYDDANKANWLK